MKLDSSTAWLDATQMISANRDILAVLCGVFMFLPSLVLGVTLGQPEQSAGEDPKVLFAALTEFYKAALPYMVLAALVQMLGQLAITRLIAGKPGCTVGEALGEALRALPVQLGVQVLIMLAWMACAGLAAAIGAVTGSVALIAVLFLGVLGVAVWAGARLILALPLTAVDGMRNPVAIIKRSWELTRGNAGSILLFMLMLAVAMIVVVVVVSAVVGVIAALVMGPDNAMKVNAGVSALAGAAFALYFTAAIAAIHRQLSPSNAAVQSAFD